eukprot:2250539-Prymnesium_polylepis.2
MPTVEGDCPLSGQHAQTPRCAARTAGCSQRTIGELKITLFDLKNADDLEIGEVCARSAGLEREERLRAK